MRTEIGQIASCLTEPARRPSAKRTFRQQKSPMLVDYVQRELADDSRTVVETEHWLAVVPYWAAWPFETLLLPKAHVLRITDLTDAQRSDLAHRVEKADQSL
ncbi:galactose-1-phosphate uridylyltransferase [Escherichia coli]